MVETLVEALENRNPSVRMSAAFALGKAGCEADIPYLERLMTDEARPRHSDMTVGEVAREAIEEIHEKPIRKRPPMKVVRRYPSHPAYVVVTARGRYTRRTHHRPKTSTQ